MTHSPSLNIQHGQIFSSGHGHQFLVFLYHKVLYVGYLVKSYDSHLLYIYYISPYFISFPSSHGKHRTSGCMFSSGGLQSCFYFPKLPSETGGETWWCGQWTPNIMINWTLPGVSKKQGEFDSSILNAFHLILSAYCPPPHHWSSQSQGDVAWEKSDWCWWDVWYLNINRPQECPHHQDIGPVESGWKLVETFRWGEV